MSNFRNSLLIRSCSLLIDLFHLKYLAGDERDNLERAKLGVQVFPKDESSVLKTKNDFLSLCSCQVLTLLVMSKQWEMLCSVMEFLVCHDPQQEDQPCSWVVAAEPSPYCRPTVGVGMCFSLVELAQCFFQQTFVGRQLSDFAL